MVTATFNGFELDDDHRRLDHRKLHALLLPLFWIPDDSTLEDIATRAANSWSFGLYAPDGGDLVGFCRLVTDRISFAYLSDVVIAEPLRNKGIGAFMVETVLGLPEIEKCNMMLYTGSERRCEYYERLGEFYKLAAVPSSIGDGTRFVMERLSKHEREKGGVAGLREESSKVKRFRQKSFWRDVACFVGLFAIVTTIIVLGQLAIEFTPEQQAEQQLFGSQLPSEGGA